MDIILLVKLLSSDWFFNHWPLINLTRTSSERLYIQKFCRNFLSDKESSSGELDDNFLYVLLTADGAVERYDTQNDIISLRELMHENDNYSFLNQICYGAVLRRAAVYYAELPDSILKKMDQSWKAREHLDINLSDLTRLSKSEWDSALSDNPKFPMALAEYFQDLLRGQSFRIFWGEMLNVCSPTERTEIVKWFTAVNTKLTGRSLNFEFLDVPPA